MATQNQMERLIGKALFNAEFRQQLLEDPTAAARTLRIRLTPLQVESIQAVDPKQAEKLCEEFWGIFQQGHHGVRFW